MKVPVRDPIADATAYAVVDETDAPLIQEKRWRLVNGYAYGHCQHPTRRRYRPGKGFDRKTVQIGMHRMILGLKPGERVAVHHVNGNRLDNRRVNLRRVNRAAKLQHRRANKPTAGSLQPWSPLSGVHWDPSATTWKAVVRGTHIGVFESDLEAHQAAQAIRRECMPYSEIDKGDRL